MSSFSNCTADYNSVFSYSLSDRWNASSFFSWKMRTLISSCANYIVRYKQNDFFDKRFTVQSQMGKRIILWKLKSAIQLSIYIRGHLIFNLDSRFMDLEFIIPFHDTNKCIDYLKKSAAPVNFFKYASNPQRGEHHEQLADIEAGVWFICFLVPKGRF